MFLEELIQKLQFSPAHAVVVDRSLSPIYPGFVRSVELCEDNTARISIEPYGFDDAGVDLVGKYADLQRLVVGIEGYLGRQLEDWSDCDLIAVYPSRPENLESIIQGGYAALAKAVANQSVPFPTGAVFSMRSHL